MPASDSPPRPLEEQTGRIRAAVADATRVLVCLDFDGTLAPIVDDPDDAAPTARTQNAVAALAETNAVTTAVISGRALSDVRERIDGPSIYAGNHGLELARGDDGFVHPVAREEAARLDRLCAVLELALASVPNCRIENKRLTGTVHVRTVPPAAKPVVRRVTHDVVDRFGGGALAISSGKQILEIGPDISWGKGDAVEAIAADEPSETAVIYVGDDVTDESAFRAVEPDGIGVRVGGTEPSNASVRVDSPADVAAFLTWLASISADAADRADIADVAPSTASEES